MTLSRMKVEKTPAGWKKPPKPRPRSCGPNCGVKVQAEYLDAIAIGDRVLSGTGIWIYPEACPGCDSRAAAAVVAAAERHAEQREKQNTLNLLARAGFDPIHEIMRRKTFQPATDKVEETLNAYARGEANVFCYGAAGTGKTHFAVDGLSNAITRSGKRGRFELMPELFMRLRKAAKDFEDEKEIGEISSASYLALDDLGAERPTAFVLEALYLIIDRWHRMGKAGLIVTSNLSPAELAERVDDRLVSRLVEMSTVLKFEGRDRRIS